MSSLVVTEGTKLAEVIRATLLLPKAKAIIVGSSWSRTLLGGGCRYTTAHLYGAALACNFNRWHSDGQRGYHPFRFDLVITDPERKAYTLG